MSLSPTPIGVFWDIENCQVPKFRSALSVVQRIRERFFTNHREAEFMCVCDIHKENKDVVQELNAAQVNVIHINAFGKNAADDKLRQSLRRFADTHSPPCTIVLISSDVNFACDLSDLRHRRKYQIILIHHRQAHEALLLCANEHYTYESIIHDIPCRTPAKCEEGRSELEVRGFKLDTHCDPGKIRNRLKQLSSNQGGRVLSVTEDYAIVKFGSPESASRAKNRMDGEDVYGGKITVEFSVHTRPKSIPAITKPQTDGKNGQELKKPQQPRSASKSKTKPSADRESGTPPHGQSASEERQWSPARNNMNRITKSRNHSAKPPAGNASVKSEPITMVTSPDTSVQSDIKQVVEKFSKDTKPTRSMLMLQQQIYQEEQLPSNVNNSATSASNNMAATTVTAVSAQLQKYSNYHHSNYMHQYSSYEEQYCGYQRSSAYHQYSGSYQHHWAPGSDRYYNYRPPPYNMYNMNYYQNRSSPVYGVSNGFHPIRSISPCPSSSSSSSPFEEEMCGDDAQASVELLVSNLDYNISAREWRKILFTTFYPHVKVLNIHVKTQPDNTSIGMVKVQSVEEARLAISQFHRKKIGYKRIHVTLKHDDSQKAANSIRAEAVALLTEAKGHVLPLFKFIELFDKRYHRSISVSELYKMRDTIEIREQGGAGRMVYLVPGIQKSPTPETVSDYEVQEILEQPACQIHSPEGSTAYAESMNSSNLPNVDIHLKTFATQVHSLLQSHFGNMPLMSFPACYAAEFSPLLTLQDTGVPLEHLISCVPGIQIQVSPAGVKKVQWAENRPPASLDFGKSCSSPVLTQQLNQIGREIVDLLKNSLQCRMPFSKFIPAYHHHFGRQCRVADYGYTRLMELFEAMPHILQVLGTGDRKMLTLSHRAQVRRFTADLVRVLKSQLGKQITLSELPESFGKLLNKPFDIMEYGVCHLDDILAEIPPTTVMITTEGNESIVAIPRRDQTPDEVERCKQFCLEVVDLLKHNPRCRMPFNKFIPAYHHHFGRQCRVSDYGFNKLMDLFEALPYVVEIDEEGEERFLHLIEPELRKVLAEQIINLLRLQTTPCLATDQFLNAFLTHYGFPIELQDYGVDTVEELMSKLKHVVKLEYYNGRSYVVLSGRSRAPSLAYQVLKLLMDQSGGSLPLMELCSRYKTSYGVDCDIKKIREELLDFVQVTGDDESAVISLTSLQTLARDIRVLLQAHGSISLCQFERVYQEHFGVEIKPALYGFPTVFAVLQAIPHIVTLKGKGNRKMVHLSGDLSGRLSPISPNSLSYRSLFQRRPDSDTPSNDSGVTDTQDEEMMMAEIRPPSPLDFLGMSVRSCGEVKPPSPLDFFCVPVPSNIPSPDLLPHNPPMKDLMNFEHTSGLADHIWGFSEEEKKGQKTPLCKTPTSQLLQLAAECLITNPPSDHQPCSKTTSPAQLNDGITHGVGIRMSRQVEGGSQCVEISSSQELLQLLKGGWWRASPDQLAEVSRNLQPYPDTGDLSIETNSDTTERTCSVTQDSNETITNAELEPSAVNDGEKKVGTNVIEDSEAGADNSGNILKTESSTCVENGSLLTRFQPKPIAVRQDGDHTDSSELQQICKSLDLEQNSQQIGEQENISTSDCTSYSNITLVMPNTSSSNDKCADHRCIVSEGLSFDSFRQDPPLDTSSVRSHNSSLSDASSSPRKSPRRSRIAAKFNVPMDMGSQ